MSWEKELRWKIFIRSCSRGKAQHGVPDKELSVVDDSRRLNADTNAWSRENSDGNLSTEVSVEVHKAQIFSYRAFCSLWYYSDNWVVYDEGRRLRADTDTCIAAIFGMRNWAWKTLNQTCSMQSASEVISTHTPTHAQVPTSPAKQN